MSTKSYFHKYQRPVYTCLRCVNSTPIDGRLYCPVFQKNVHPDEKACIYKDVKKMKQLRIYRPALEKSVHNKSEYARQMIQHLQDVEDWQRTMHETKTEGWGVCQLWTFTHRDGRIARLPDPCPTNKMRIASQKRQQQWIKLRLLAISLQFKNE